MRGNVESLGSGASGLKAVGFALESCMLVEERLSEARQ